MVFGNQMGSKQKIIGVWWSDTKGIAPSSYPLNLYRLIASGLPVLKALLLVFGAGVG